MEPAGSLSGTSTASTHRLQMKITANTKCYFIVGSSTLILARISRPEIGGSILNDAGDWIRDANHFSACESGFKLCGNRIFFESVF